MGGHVGDAEKHHRAQRKRSLECGHYCLLQLVIVIQSRTRCRPWRPCIPVIEPGRVEFSGGDDQFAKTVGVLDLFTRQLDAALGDVGVIAP